MNCLCLLLSLLGDLELAEEPLPFVLGLEPAAAELGGGVDPLKVDLFGSNPPVVDVDGLPEGDGPLGSTADRALDHEEVVVNVTVPGEAAHWVDGLLGEVELGGAGGVLLTLGWLEGKPVDPLVHLGSVVETVVTGSADSPEDPPWVEWTNAGDLPATSVSLLLKALSTIPVDNTFPTAALADGDDVDLFALFEDVVDLDLLFEEALGEVDLVSDAAAVDLDLDDLGLAGTEHDSLWLGVGDHTDDGSLGLDLVEPLLHLALLGSLGDGAESLAGLGLVPVLVVAALDFLTDEASPGGGDWLDALWGLLVTDDTDGEHWWGLDDGDWLDGLLLVKAGVSTDNLTENVGHTSLEADESAKMWLLGLVILWPAPDAAANMAGATTWEETERSTAWSTELTVAHVQKGRPGSVNI